MKKPEWLKKLEAAIAERKTKWNDTFATEIDSHIDNTDIHRNIHISTVSPTNTDGEDGDIWITYEA